jgi:hypothetical protein
MCDTLQTIEIINCARGDGPKSVWRYGGQCVERFRHLTERASPRQTVPKSHTCRHSSATAAPPPDRPKPSSPDLSRRSRLEGHRASTIGGAGTSPATAVATTFAPLTPMDSWCGPRFRQGLRPRPCFAALNVAESQRHFTRRSQSSRARRLRGTRTASNRGPPPPRLGRKMRIDESDYRQCRLLRARRASGRSR